MRLTSSESWSKRCPWLQCKWRAASLPAGLCALTAQPTRVNKDGSRASGAGMLASSRPQTSRRISPSFYARSAHRRVRSSRASPALPQTPNERRRVAAALRLRDAHVATCVAPSWAHTAATSVGARPPPPATRHDALPSRPARRRRNESDPPHVATWRAGDQEGEAPSRPPIRQWVPIQNPSLAWPSMGERRSRIRRGAGASLFQVSVRCPVRADRPLRASGRVSSILLAHGGHPMQSGGGVFRRSGRLRPRVVGRSISSACVGASPMGARRSWRARVPDGGRVILSFLLCFLHLLFSLRLPASPPPARLVSRYSAASSPCSPSLVFSARSKTGRRHPASMRCCACCTICFFWRHM